MKLDKLKSMVKSVDKRNDSTFLKTLDKRKLEEIIFHNKTRELNAENVAKDQNAFEKYYGNKVYYETIGRSDKYVKDWIIKETKDLVFLDYACGNGHNALLAAQSGAALSIGFDISDISIKNCEKKAETNGIKNSIFLVADCENTGLPDNCIDVCICSGMLHHLDLSFAIPELRRIMKPGGKVLCGEALNYNPAIKLYRKLTPSMRTEYEKEHILNFSDVRFISRFFDVREMRFWHVVGYLGAKIPILRPILNLLDGILEKIPVLRRMAWIFTFVLIKKKAN